VRAATRLEEEQPSSTQLPAAMIARDAAERHNYYDIVIFS